MANATEWAQVMSEIDNQWISTVLGDHLKNNESVTGIRQTEIGEGQGFAGKILRINIDYDRPTDAPSSVIVKIPADNPRINATLHQRKMFFREARFYQEIGPTIRSRIPHIFHVHIDEAGNDYAIVMEDLGNISNDVETYLTSDQVKQSLDAIAEFHVAYWNHPLTMADWLTPITDTGDRLHDLERVKDGIAELEQYEGDIDYLLSCARLIGLHMMKAPAHFPLPKPVTLNHGDFHPNNIALLPEGIVFYDWQVVSRGMPAGDVVNFIVSSLDPESLPALQEELFKHYHDELVRLGITDYSYRKFRRSCNDVLFITIIKYLVVLGMVDFNVEGGAQMKERVIAVLDVIARETHALKRCRQLPVFFLMLKVASLFTR